MKVSSNMRGGGGCLAVYPVGQSALASHPKAAATAAAANSTGEMLHNGDWLTLYSITRGNELATDSVSQKSNVQNLTFSFSLLLQPKSRSSPARCAGTRAAAFTTASSPAKDARASSGARSPQWSTTSVPVRRIAPSIASTATDVNFAAFKNVYNWECPETVSEGEIASSFGQEQVAHRRRRRRLRRRLPLRP